ncbi:MAG: hypothetical protein U1E77_13575 [Inhella sp.]
MNTGPQASTLAEKGVEPQQAHGGQHQVQGLAEQGHRQQLPPLRTRQARPVPAEIDPEQQHRTQRCDQVAQADEGHRAHQSEQGLLQGEIQAPDQDGGQGREQGKRGHGAHHALTAFLTFG